MRIDGSGEYLIHLCFLVQINACHKFGVQILILLTLIAIHQTSLEKLSIIASKYQNCQSPWAY